ncbi:MAG: serine/threonine-protein kinase [Aeromicrobium sp.]|uniref:serine/threonine-protein kinase n=1 Tax=Aeromicrobium sp. TaxID=1871063 RepID=UPI0039E3D00C
MSRVEPGAPLGASYRLVEWLGAGAAGDVWRVESTAEDTSFAAKILKAEHANDPAIVEQFIRERSVLLGLRHPGIVAVRDLVVEGSVLAIVMDYVAGGSLRDLLEQRSTLAPAEALSLLSQVFAGLAEAHARQVTHRDVKPDNVLLASAPEPGGQTVVRVVDFGIASVMSERKRHTTGILGTPHYMAPELISHGQAGPAVDVYAAGVTLYELLAGRTPFADGGGTDFTVAYRHVTTKPPRLDLPEPLADWVETLLAKDPRERPSAGEAAVQARRLASEYGALPALSPSPAVTEFEEMDRPATMLRGETPSTDDTSSGYVSPLAETVPELGESHQATMLRPAPKPSRPSTPRPAEVDEPEEGEQGFFRRFNRTSLLLAGAGVLLVVALGVGLVWLFGGGSDQDKEAATNRLEASQQDQPLPTGLSVSRSASYDPAAETVTVEFTYTAQKAPLSGPFLEVVPAFGEGSGCPAVAWDRVDAGKHQASSGVKATCGWKLDNIEIPANGKVTFTGTTSAVVADITELDAWITEAATLTQEALTDGGATSTEYPAQRIQGVDLVVPPRTVSQTALPITVVPVWPSGPDELNPLYQSPSTGAPTQMLRQIAGEEGGVRFSDSCSGAVAVSSDGLTVTTLSPTSACQIHASIGNFTDVQSSPFSITTRE